ncbi:hypothetical protein LINGRAHAP2_LOCUS2602 [Linum grandiflorum]
MPMPMFKPPPNLRLKVFVARDLYRNQLMKLLIQKIQACSRRIHRYKVSLSPIFIQEIVR